MSNSHRSKSSPSCSPKEPGRTPVRKLKSKYLTGNEKRRQMFARQGQTDIAVSSGVKEILEAIRWANFWWYPWKEVRRTDKNILQRIDVSVQAFQFDQKSDRLWNCALNIIPCSIPLKKVFSKSGDYQSKSKHIPQDEIGKIADREGKSSSKIGTK